MLPNKEPAAAFSPAAEELVDVLTAVVPLAPRFPNRPPEASCCKCGGTACAPVDRKREPVVGAPVAGGCPKREPAAGAPSLGLSF